MLLHTHLHVAGPDQRHLLDGKALVGCMVNEQAHSEFNMHGMACLAVVSGVQEAAGGEVVLARKLISELHTTVCLTSLVRKTP